MTIREHWMALAAVVLITALGAGLLLTGGDDSMPCHVLEDGQEPSDLVDTEQHEITILNGDGERYVCVTDSGATTDVFNGSDDQIEEVDR